MFCQVAHFQEFRHKHPSFNKKNVFDVFFIAYSKTLWELFDIKLQIIACVSTCTRKEGIAFYKYLFIRCQDNFFTHPMRYF